MNDSWELRWNAGDEISLFNGTVNNLKFGFSGEEGATGVSFARGANTMVSVTDNQSDKLLFKNVCGYVQFKLYGDGASVTSVTLRREICLSALRRRGRPDRYAGFPD
jgi:hypothetical protein